MKTKQPAERREADYRLSKWTLKNMELLLTPDEIETIWTELLSFYEPVTASVENVCGTLDDPLGGYESAAKKGAADA
jgi:hypothetical protein